MAYWRRYRKCSAEASALALHDSSSDGETDQSPDGSGTLSSLEIDPTSCAPDKVLDVEDSCNANSSPPCDNQAGASFEGRILSGSSSSCCSDRHSDFDESVEYENFEVDINAPSSPITLRKELATRATKHHCRRGPTN
jgi:hypothetical protein